MKTLKGLSFYGALFFIGVGIFQLVDLAFGTGTLHQNLILAGVFVVADGFIEGCRRVGERQ